jgi:HEAT repeat protein
MRFVVRLPAVALAISLTIAAQLGAQPSPDPVREEELRRAVELAIAESSPSSERADVDVDRFVATALDLARRGPEVVSALTAELEQALPGSYFFCAYTLGLIGGPQAAAALESAVARAEAETGDFAFDRKAWACHGLGLIGRVDAIEMLNAGRHRTAPAAIHAGTSALEVVAVLTAPAGLPLLEAEFDRYTDDDDPNTAYRVVVLKAIARIADPSVLPMLERALASPGAGVRHHAARAIGAVSTPQATEKLLAALADPDTFARLGVAIGLRDAPPIGQTGRLLDRLDVEDDPVVRGELYQLVVRHGSSSDLARLGTHWGRPNPEDRRFLMRALADAPADFALPILARGLSDPERGVSVIAAFTLARLGDPRAIDLLTPIVASADWAPAQSAVEALATLGDPRGAAPILKRLLETELPQRITDPRQNLRIEKLLTAVVTLRDTSRLTELTAARDIVSDPAVRELLAKSLAVLDAVAEAGNKSKRWIALLDSPNADLRLLAYSRLGQLGGESSARALADRFGRVDPAEAREILRALGSIPGPASRELVRRALVDPSFDAAERSDLRDMAAWSARRIGGPAMVDALREAVDRRDGRDGRPFVYYAVLAGTSAIPDIERLRGPRFRYLGASRGAEDERLQWARRELRAGRSIARLDVPPERLDTR